MLEKLLLFAATAGLLAAPVRADGAGGARGQAGQDISNSRPVAFVSASQAAALIAGGATVLDARARGYFWGHLPSAQSIDWLDLRDGWGRTGRLDDDLTRLERKLEQRGVDGQRPVVVYGESRTGFGEEGRIAWMLAYLGHPRVAILDGGIAAWRQAGQSVARGLSPRVSPGARFVLSPAPTMRADKAAVLTASRDHTPILDVRSREEFGGATPYLEARGGHIPGAQHLDWQALLDDAGRLRSTTELAARLRESGIERERDQDAAIIVYCTGGVRSAFVWAVLRRLGFSRVRNYDGSFWEWAADKQLAVSSTSAASATSLPKAR